VVSRLGPLDAALQTPAIGLSTCFAGSCTFPYVLSVVQLYVLSKWPLSASIQRASVGCRSNHPVVSQVKRSCDWFASNQVGNEKKKSKGEEEEEGRGERGGGGGSSGRWNLRGGKGDLHLVVGLHGGGRLCDVGVVSSGYEIEDARSEEEASEASGRAGGVGLVDGEGEAVSAHDDRVVRVERVTRWASAAEARTVPEGRGHSKDEVSAGCSDLNASVDTVEVEVVAYSANGMQTGIDVVQRIGEASGGNVNRHRVATLVDEANEIGSSGTRDGIDLHVVHTQREPLVVDQQTRSFRTTSHSSAIPHHNVRVTKVTTSLLRTNITNVTNGRGGRTELRQVVGARRRPNQSRVHRCSKHIHIGDGHCRTTSISGGGSNDHVKHVPSTISGGEIRHCIRLKHSITSGSRVDLDGRGWNRIIEDARRGVDPGPV